MAEKRNKSDVPSFNDLLHRYSGKKRTFSSLSRIPKDKEKETDFSNQHEVKDSKKMRNETYGYVILRISGDILSLKFDNVLEVVTNFLSSLQISFSNCIGDINEESLDFRSAQLMIKVMNKTAFLQIAKGFISNYQLIADKVVLSIYKFITDEENRQQQKKFSSQEQLKSGESSGKLENKQLKKSIVLALYRESITWLPENWLGNCFIYDKGNNTNNIVTEKYNYYEQVSNIGRESHTYLYHIIQNYENLADITYFSQANPFDHCPGFIELVNSDVGELFEFTMLGKETHKIYDLNVRKYEKDFKGIQNALIKTCKKLFSSKNNSLIEFTPGAIIAVKREKIQQHPKEFYETALSLLSYHFNPIEGHCFERLWNVFFGG